LGFSAKKRADPGQRKFVDPWPKKNRIGKATKKMEESEGKEKPKRGNKELGVSGKRLTEAKNKEKRNQITQKEGGRKDLEG